MSTLTTEQIDQASQLLQNGNPYEAFNYLLSIIGYEEGASKEEGIAFDTGFVRGVCAHIEITLYMLKQSKGRKKDD